MAVHPPQGPPQVRLGTDFADRLTATLDAGDRDRRRVAWMRRVQRTLPVLLLVGPIIAWHLMLSGPDGLHLMVGLTAALTFRLDVAVHADTILLRFLHVSWLPGAMGVLLFLLVAGTLLSEERRDDHP